MARGTLRNSKQGKMWSYFPVRENVLEACRGWTERSPFSSLSWLDKSQTRRRENRGEAAERLERPSRQNGWQAREAKGEWTVSIPSSVWLEKTSITHGERARIWVKRYGKECSCFKKDQGLCSSSVVDDWLIENIRARWVAWILLVTKPIAFWIPCGLRKAMGLEKISYLTRMGRIQKKKNPWIPNNLSTVFHLTLSLSPLKGCFARTKPLFPVMSTAFHLRWLASTRQAEETVKHGNKMQDSSEMP